MSATDIGLHYTHNRQQQNTMRPQAYCKCCTPKPLPLGAACLGGSADGAVAASACLLLPSLAFASSCFTSS